MATMIKLRVWSKDLSKYRKLDDISNDQGLGMLFEVQKGIGSNVTSICYSIGDVVEQFTGLKDVNGNEIYEGDILHFGSIWCVGDEYDPREEEHIGLVEYRPDYASYVVNCNGKIYPLEQVISFDGYSVHGNAHENPELLKG
ncbi:hypothetical protein IMAU10566_00992 [Lactiplantibacillus plantarum]|nr:hypothetical protein [Lactiplantibacillus plantarum]